MVHYTRLASSLEEGSVPLRKYHWEFTIHVADEGKIRDIPAPGTDKVVMRELFHDTLTGWWYWETPQAIWGVGPGRGHVQELINGAGLTLVRSPGDVVPGSVFVGRAYQETAGMPS